MAAPALDGVATVSTSTSGDYDDLDTMGFIHTGLTDLAGNPVVVVVARNFVAKHANLDAVFKYVQHKCDSIVEAGPYSVVWYHTTAKYWENCPSLRWLWRTYEQLPSAYRTNLSKVFVVHPDFTLWVSMMCVCPWFTGAMWRKVEWISRVEFLWDYIDKRKLPIPSFVKEHDNILEESPLVDYGIVTDKDVAFQGMPAPH